MHQILEKIYLWIGIERGEQNPADIRVWQSLLRKDLNFSVSIGQSYYEGLIDLFDVNNNEKTISYSVYNGEELFTVDIKAVEHLTEVTGLEYKRLLGMISLGYNDGKDEEIENEQMHIISCLEMSIYINGQWAINSLMQAVATK